tara:strand:- start:373 stop:1203 length:831 start_codon:yes stop_codon:yes gene_type:complete
MKQLLLIILSLTVISCSKNNEDSSKYSLGKNVIGKWDISNSAKKYNSCTIFSVVFSATEFIINYSNGQLKGVYTVDSETQITLSNTGLISNISVSDSNISFDISIGDCTTSASGTKDETYVDGECTSFLECNNEIMWQGTGSEYSEGLYIGFSNNITEVLFHRRCLGKFCDYCFKYKVGENKFPNSAECNYKDGEYTGASATFTYTIITNTKNKLVLNVNTYDESCDNTPFSYDYRFTYDVDDYLYELIESITFDSNADENNKYSKSTYSFNSLCD